MHTLSAQEIHKHFCAGTLSARNIAEYFLNRIQSKDTSTGAFLELYNSDVLELAEQLDKKRARGEPLGKMAAVPIALKDNIHVHGKRTTCASKILCNYTAVFDATVTKRLKEEDALILGKTNLDEFAMGSSTEKSSFQKTKNPWDLSLSPGGSSGGSAAAVAARYTPLSLGSDTGGSVRQPAALCGVCGFKPTYGRVSRYGLVAFASSLDQIGPFACSAEDLAYVMETIASPCLHDSTHIRTSVPSYLNNLKLPLKKLKLGIPWHFLEHLGAQERESFKCSLSELKKLDAEIVEVDLHLLKYSIAVYSILATAEASTNLARYDGIRYGLRSPHANTLEEIYELSRQEGFGQEVKKRILLGTYVLSSGHNQAYYQKAQKARTLIIEQLRKAFNSCDLLVMPTSPTVAFPLDSIQDPIQMYLQDVYTIAANLAGLPAVSIPAGFLHNRPFGLQFIGRQGQDSLVLQLAHQFQTITTYHRQIPPLFAKELF